MLTSVTRRFATLALLLAFTLPAILGVGTHSLVASSESGDVVATCPCCQAPTQEDESRWNSDADCLVCRYLTFAKSHQFVSCPPLISTNRVEWRPSAYSCRLPVLFSLTTAPRGPPSV